MIWIIGFLTGVLILTCLFLVLLILVQLPKKEAGLGQAFGGGTTDALFGAGSGNALTKLTKYATVIFLVLTLVLSVLHMQYKNKPSDLQQGIQELSRGEPAAPANPVVPTPLATNIPAAPAVEAPATPPTPATGTNPAPAPRK